MRPCRKISSDRFRLSRSAWLVRAAIVLVVAAIALKIGVVTYRRTVAVRKLELAGGSVDYSPVGPVWLHRLMGKGQLYLVSEAVCVRLVNNPLAGREMEYVGDLHGLEDLILSGTPLTDSGFKHVQRLTRLKRLYMPGTQITDDGLKSISRLTKLERLNLDGTRIGDDGLLHVKALTKLRELSLNGTQITDAGLRHLCDLRDLNRLSLERTRITDGGLRHLKVLRELRHLSLDETEITSGGLQHLEGLLSLTTLSIAGTHVQRLMFEDEILLELCVADEKRLTGRFLQGWEPPELLRDDEHAADSQADSDTEERRLPQGIVNLKRVLPRLAINTTPANGF